MAKIPVHQLVGQRGKAAYFWDNKIHCTVHPLISEMVGTNPISYNKIFRYVKYCNL